MRTLLPVALILITVLTVGIAGDWIVDNVSIANRLHQTAPASTNAVMGSLGIGTAAPTAKLHVIGDSKMEGVLDLASNRVVNLALPLEDGDAISKSYVEALLQNIQPGGGISMGIYTNR